MSILQGAILGLVQGIGEFLPISSSAHVLLLSRLMGMEINDAYKIIVILLHLGTLIPILIVFRREWLEMILHPIRNKTLLYLFVASLPSLAVYLLFDLDVFDSGWMLGPAFLFTGILLMVCDLIGRRKEAQASEEVGLKHAVCMGLMQGLALLPGISRLGSTLFGGVASGLKREKAIRFSFMMSAVAILASLVAEGRKAFRENLFSHIEVAPTVVAVVVALVAGYVTIRLMLRVIIHHSLSWFSLYLVLLAIVLLVTQLAQMQFLPEFTYPAGASLIKFGR